MDAEVLIIGAGAAGIAAAKTLYDNGVTNMKILEGRSDRLGGRVRNIEFGGVQIELGASWIIGLRDLSEPGLVNPLWPLANDPSCFENGELLRGVYYTYSYLTYDQDPTNASAPYVNVTQAANDLMTEYYYTILPKIEEASRMLPNDSDITVRAALRNSGWKRETSANSRLFDLIDWVGHDYVYTQPPESSSLRQSYPDATYTDFGYSDYFVTDQRGYVSILECAAKNITSKIQLGATVNSVSWNDECVCANVTRNGNEESRMCGSYGISTFSLGVLQDWVNSNPSKFDPPFSSAKKNAINYNKMTYNLKIFVEFPEKFWHRYTEAILRTDEVRGRYPMILLIGDFIPGNPNILLIDVLEKEALRLGNGTNIDLIEGEMMEILRDIYGENIPSPTDIIVPTWITDPLYRGMYPTFEFGYNEQLHAELIKPEGRFYISGDAMSYKYRHNVHGAYLSGERVANAIVQDRASTRPDAAATVNPAAVVTMCCLFLLLAMLSFY